MKIAGRNSDGFYDAGFPDRCAESGRHRYRQKEGGASLQERERLKQMHFYERKVQRCSTVICRNRRGRKRTTGRAGCGRGSDPAGRL